LPFVIWLSAAADRRVDDDMIAIVQHLRLTGVGALVDGHDHAALDVQLRQQVADRGAVLQRERGAPPVAGRQFVAQEAVQKNRDLQPETLH
jgi:hypothetical protein